MKQRTDEWFEARLGKVTASRIADVMAKTKSGYSASRNNYRAELLCQRLTGQREEGFTSAAMQRGTDLEPVARTEYEFSRDVIVEEVGFVQHPTIEQSGASPDGLVGDDGMVEIKCPNTATHIDTLLKRKVDRKYLLQIQWQLACTGREWCDFVSFDDRMPEGKQIVIIRVDRDDELISEIAHEVRVFLTELDELCKEVEAA